MSEIKVDGKHGGTKMDGDKPQYGLLPPDSLRAVAEVMTSGAKKYSANNWVNLEISRVIDALERHVNAFKSGEEYAEDSGQHHLAHAIANTMMAYHILMNKPNQDDRLFKYIAHDKIPLAEPETPKLVEDSQKFCAAAGRTVVCFDEPHLYTRKNTSEPELNGLGKPWGWSGNAKTVVEGTFACPHCGIDTPHTHTLHEINLHGNKISYHSKPEYISEKLTKPEFLSEEEIFQDLINADTQDITAIDKKDLISLHNTTGRWIRNTYKMWDKNNPYVIQDHPEDELFPDQVSQRIIERLHSYWSDVEKS